MNKVKVFPLSRSLYASQIYSGLFDLAAAGEIELEFTWHPQIRIHERDWGSLNNNRIVYLEVWPDVDGSPCKVCYDMLDGPEIISLDGIEQCDVYFKRSYSSKYLDLQSDVWQKKHPEWRNKIFPYGLNFPCDSRFEFDVIKRLLIFNYATGWFYREPYKALRLLISTLIKGSRKLSSVTEVPPEVKSEPCILLQTRLFDPAHLSPKYIEDNVNFNEFRVAILRALKKEFGKRFIGGLIPNDYTRKHYSDLITTEKTDQKSYLDLVGKCQIVVFTKGLRFSTGWRLPELLAMSRCIVSEPLEYELPDPLQEGKNYLLYNSPDECVEACIKLLNDEELIKKIRLNNYQYYNSFVKASSLIRNTLDIAKAIGNK